MSGDINALWASSSWLQGEELEPARAKAEKMGVKQIFIDDLREEFVRDYVFPMFRYVLGRWKAHHRLPVTMTWHLKLPLHLTHSIAALTPYTRASTYWARRSLAP